tara:strand:+ start:372 stop:782 length:411 start_codon:yes stop_codon:yes gene_type:complete
MIGYIYKIVNGDNMYIGSTTQTLLKRGYKHNYKLRKEIYKYKLYEFCRDNNITNLILTEIEELEIETKKELNMVEQKYMNFFKPNLNQKKAYRSKEELILYDKNRHKKQTQCPHCNKCMRKDSLWRHRKVCVNIIQ